MNIIETSLLINCQEVLKREAKTLYEENAERRKRAAIPSTRTTAYKIAPQVDKSLLMRQQSRHASNDERFKRINLKLTSMSVKRKAAKRVVHRLKVEIWQCKAPLYS